MPLDRGEVAAGNRLGRLLGEVLHRGEFTPLQATGDPFDLFFAGDQFWPGGGVLTISPLRASRLGQIHCCFQMLPQHMVGMLAADLDNGVLPLCQLLGEDPGGKHLFLIHKHDVPRLPAHLGLNGEDDQEQQQGEKDLSHNFHKIVPERRNAKPFLRSNQNGGQGNPGQAPGRKQTPRPMTLAQRIVEDMKTAMKAKDTVALNVVRGLKSSLKYAAIEKLGADGELSDADAIPVIRREIKKRQDSVASYESASRADLADMEKAEIAVLEKYLPAAMSNEDVIALVEAVIAEVGATTKKDMGGVMKVLQERTEGRADNKILSQEVSKRLN